jgi:8-oxo-dGTP pyrophosphatase MutT (NUDIX family)
MTALRRASTVCVVRDNADAEILMVRRPMTARFMPGVWVFPGGAVEEADADAPPSFGGNYSGSDWKVAALRELIEETGLWITSGGSLSAPLTQDAFGEVESSEVVLDPDSLIYFSNWITPAVFPIRFDTRFFLTVVEADASATVDGEELIDLRWISPMEALQKEHTGEWDVAFPTRRTLRLLGSEPTVSALVQTLNGIGAVPAIEPRLYVGDSDARILMPDDDGFDEAGPAQKDSTILERLSVVVAEGGAVPADFRTRA